MAIEMKRATVAVELCTDMELNARHEELSALLKENRTKGVQDDRLTGDPVAAEIVELEQRMAEHVLVFTLRAMRRKEWSALKASHPPREGEQMDEAYSVNVETFFDEALAKSVESVHEKATGERVEWSSADWVGLSEEMSNGQWETFALRVFSLNNSNVGVPFNLAVSRETPSSGEK